MASLDGTVMMTIGGSRGPGRAGAVPVLAEIAGPVTRGRDIGAATRLVLAPVTGRPSRVSN